MQETTASFSSKPYVIMEEKQRSFLEMSFVGLLNCNEALLAFGDTKTTFLMDGRFTEGKHQRKVFRGKDYLVAVHGTNQYAKDGEVHDLETLMNRIVDLPMEELPLLLYKELKETLKQEIQYHFLFGKKHGFSANFSTLLLSREKICYEMLPSGTQTLCGGELSYVPKEIKYNEEILHLEELKELAKECFIMAKKFGDKYLPYNPIGGDLLFETLSLPLSFS